MTNTPNRPAAPALWRESTHPAGQDNDALLAQCELVRGRTSGPGGQHRNRVATEVVLHHTPTGITARAGERRSPEINKKVAVGRLRYTLAVEVRTSIPAGEARTPLWAQRCSKSGRIVCSATHRDHATLIAEALDVIAACKWDTKRAAVRLGCTQTQMVRMLADHPPALAKLNAERAKRGMRPLRA
ncbi:MAG: peptide chain release factor-like protein [Planctomycetota bacterium]|nr:peptide chain release factor-like protein [Planctomycetota bacterium]